MAHRHVNTDARAFPAIKTTMKIATKAAPSDPDTTSPKIHKTKKAICMYSAAPRDRGMSQQLTVAELVVADVEGIVQKCAHLQLLGAQ